MYRTMEQTQLGTFVKYMNTADWIFGRNAKLLTGDIMQMKEEGLIRKDIFLSIIFKHEIGLVKEQDPGMGLSMKGRPLLPLDYGPL